MFSDWQPFNSRDELHNRDRNARIRRTIIETLPGVTVSDPVVLRPAYQFVINPDLHGKISLDALNSVASRHGGVKFELDPDKGNVIAFVQKEYTFRFPRWAFLSTLTLLALAAIATFVTTNASHLW